MCGIVGFVNDASGEDKKVILKQMTDVIIHRGPDEYGEMIDDHIAMGFRRLSIIDHKMGSQPIENEDGNLVITYNGEIYNYQPLREQLIAAGHQFKSKSDTEVILHGYEEWGKGLLQHLRGMFAFVIWDKQKQELFGARDHFGIKPFYYAQMNGTFFYASEIKAMLPHPQFVKELNPDALRPYLTFQYPAINETFFKGVFKLKEGHCFTLRNGKMQIERYYDPDFRESKQELSELVESIDRTVRESVDAHMIADVEVGSFLSSGVDSSYVAAVARPDHTYSIGFDSGKYNESQQAHELAKVLDLQNTTAVINPQVAFRNFPLIQWHLDEPDSNFSCVPLFFLAQLAAKDLKAVLSGEGADELFAGYIDYGVHTSSKVIKVFTRFCSYLPAKIRYGIANFAKNKTFHGAWHLYSNLAPAEESFIGQSLVFKESESDRFLRPEYRRGPSVRSIVGETYGRLKGKNLSELKKKQYLDMHQWMPGDILLKADKMTMAHSLELRVPLLDRELMKVAEQVPTKWLITDQNTKYAFRQAAAQHIPREWYDREKLGFPVPVKDWLRDEKYYREVRELFASDTAAKFFNRELLLQLVDDNFAGRVDERRKIWTVYTFLVWYTVYFIHDGSKPVIVHESE
ncbi:asparagine synthase (glutamine-hydrolyzing) [Varibaculum vaginae]|uniref:asparagine synthase (glutamine-hydrolyzing) n=1 Tax=Varibaculum vaginae TaxID=2364797 RepID=UPI000F086FB4|nr:asparagine synthase (glutamine-hydrolyzing) [Varibaculum vaginae]